MRNVNEFIDYFIDFYSHCWTDTFSVMPSREKILAGIILRGKYFEGDSLDREWIRDCILTSKNGKSNAWCKNDEDQ